MIQKNAREVSAGFTLIEMLIVVAVIGILAVIAYPSFLEQIRKSRRGEAISALNKVSQAQERWRANNASYTTDLSSSGLNLSNPSSGNYTLAVSLDSATQSSRYVVTATATGRQASDSRCATISMTVDRGNITYSATPSGNSTLCWNR